MVVINSIALILLGLVIAFWAYYRLRPWVLMLRVKIMLRIIAWKIKRMSKRHDGDSRKELEKASQMIKDVIKSKD